MTILRFEAPHWDGTTLRHEVPIAAVVERVEVLTGASPGGLSTSSIALVRLADDRVMWVAARLIVEVSP